MYLLIGFLTSCSPEFVLGGDGVGGRGLEGVAFSCCATGCCCCCDFLDLVGDDDVVGCGCCFGGEDLVPRRRTDSVDRESTTGMISARGRK